MHKLVLSYNSSIIDQNMLEKMYEETDEIFAQEDIICASRESEKRVYHDKGRKQDYGKFWAAIFALKNESNLAENLEECYWYNGNVCENLITDFMRN